MTASRTQYKDELIRVAQALGLPDDTDPTAVSEAVTAMVTERDRLVLEKANAPALHNGETTARRLLDVVTQAADRLERERGSDPRAGAFGHMTLIAEYLRSEVGAARMALGLPADA